MQVVDVAASLPATPSRTAYHLTHSARDRVVIVVAGVRTSAEAARNAEAAGWRRHALAGATSTR